MKKVTIWLLLVLLITAVTTNSKAQTTYNNEWIDYSKTYYKVKVIHDALHRIPASVLSDNGLNVAGEDLVMYYLGEEVPIYVTNSGMLGANDYIEFYGENRNHEFDTQLYGEAEWQLNPYRSSFSDEAIYFLTVKTGANNLRFQNTDSTLPASLPSAEPFFFYTSGHYNKNSFFGGIPYRTLGGVNNFYPTFYQGEGYTGVAIAEGQNTDYRLVTKAAYPNAGNAQVETKVVGISDDFLDFNDHHLLVKVNNINKVDTIYEGYNTLDIEFELTIDELDDSLTFINYTSLNDLGANSDKNSVVYTQITYPRYFDFGNQPKFHFTIPNDGDKYLEIENFNGSVAPILYDVTNNLRIEPVYENSTYKVFLPQIGTAPKRKLVFYNTDFICNHLCAYPGCEIDLCGLLEVSAISSVDFIDYTTSENQGDYLIITHPRLMQGDTNQVERYKQYRSSSEGGDYTVAVSDVTQLYDQYTYGIATHPLAIRNYMNQAVDIWSITPGYALLLGKSIEYNRVGTNPMEYEENLVPTYGHRASDTQLLCRNDSTYTPQVAVGRIPARQPYQVSDYLDKIMVYEAYQDCTPEERLWLKDAVHLAGGNDLDEADRFFASLNKYKDIYEEPLYAGNVLYTYTKAQQEIVDFVDLDELINNGLGVINFVGHASGEYWAVDLGLPSEYENKDKYPFIFSSSCFVGNIHNISEDVIMSEEYVLEKERGSIGFLSSVSFGFPTQMDIFIEDLYDRFCKKNYGQSIAYCIKESMKEFEMADSEDKNIRYVTQTFALAADPALVLHSWDKPEYYVDQNAMYFTPQQLTTNLDSFAVNIIVYNLGQAVEDSITVHATRNYPDGSVETKSERFLSPAYIDTLTMYLQTNNGIAEVAGDNFIEISIDADNDFEEDCEDNNVTSANTFIFSDLLVPIHPCNFSIVCNPDVTLAASTGQPILPSLSYKMEIDTSETFENPIAQNVLNSLSGVIEWNPDIAFENETVYYWRTSQLVPSSEAFNWQNSSFVFLEEDCTPGWNQSHYYQYQQDGFNQLYLDDTRFFEYYGIENQIDVSTSNAAYEDIKVVLNISSELATQTCLKDFGCSDGGIAVLAFKPATLLDPITSESINGLTGCEGRGTYGNIQCGLGTKYGFEYHTGTQEQVDACLNFVHNVIPDGYYVLVYGIFEHRLSTTDETEPIYDDLPVMEDFFAQIGAPNMMDTIGTRPFIVFGRKGISSYEATVNMPSTTNPQTINSEIFIEGKSGIGDLTSTLIGPAKKWHTLKWEANSLESEAFDEDIFDIDIYGVTLDKEEEWLFNTLEDNNFDLTSIDANQYPYLRLNASLIDSSSYTPAQLQYWRVQHDMVGELAINRNKHFVFYNDTIQEGEEVHLEFAVTNVTPVAMDSLMVNFVIIDNNNVPVVNVNQMYAPVLGNTTNIITFDYNSENLVGDNLLLVEINPNQHQLEKQRFNNVLLLPFHVTTDGINPVVDVTFDGRHILDGDIISAKPEISIKAKDENIYLPLNDPNDFNITLKYPDGSGQADWLIDVNDNNLVQFTPANNSEAAGGQNEAKLVFNPTLDIDGTYQLIVSAADRSGNEFAHSGKTYQINFQVYNTPMISNLLNYPNPFTSNTRFIFTLTGTEIPQYFKIQIMTISGKVVREITQAELGSIHIGENMTDYAWDGTDEFGNPLANGLYLYRVVSRLNGDKLDHFDNKPVDDLFKKGIGKMYLMR